MLDFNSRISERSTEEIEEREKRWFALLEKLVVFQEKRLVEAVEEEDFDMTARVLEAMMRHVSLVAVLKWLLSSGREEGRGRRTEPVAGQVKKLLLKSLEAYNYEETLLATTNRLLNDDLHQQLSDLNKVAKKGQPWRDLTCTACQEPLVASGEKDLSVRLIAFKCKHAYHASCLKESEIRSRERCPLCEGGRLSFAGKEVSSKARPANPTTNGKRVDPGGGAGSSTTGQPFNAQRSELLANINEAYKASPSFHMLRQIANKTLHV